LNLTEKRVLEIAKLNGLDQISEDDQVMQAYCALGENNVCYSKADKFLKEYGYNEEVRYRAIRDKSRFS
jgi:hypothetical protein